VTLRYKHTNGTEYEVKEFDNGFHLVIPIKSEADFRHFAKIAHAARMVPVGGNQANVISFENLEEI
jgi:hypothetical protein